MNKDETKLDDLNEWINSIKTLPAWVKLYSLNHHSPSQINEADDMWGYKYLYLTQEERRKLPGNSKMKSGNVIGGLGQKKYGNYIWEYEKGSGLIKKEVKKEKKIFEAAVEKFNLYEPVDETDKLQHEANKLSLALTWDQLQKALDEIKLKSPIECERSVSLDLPDCKLPVIGRIDYEDQNNFIELKTKWRKKNRPKQDGTSSYSIVKIKEKYMGWEKHILQVAFYYLATRKKPHLVVVNEESYHIFTPDNCQYLKPANLEKYINKMSLICANRERIMEKHAGKSTWVEDIIADLDHYFWKGMGDHKVKAARLWGLA